MSSLQSRKRQRQQYLRAKSKAVTKTTLWSVLFVTALVVCVLAGILVFDGETRRFYHLSREGMWAVCLFAVVIAGWQAFYLACHVISGQKAIGDVPYVPPVGINTLPQEDVLVRASSQTTHEQPSVLLRAAYANGETPPEQLLRPAGGKEDTSH